jgi:hypothetical protein
MDEGHIIKWEARSRSTKDKDASWYWTVGILAVGVAVAAIISGNYLFSLIALLGGFAIMLAGSQGPAHHAYAVSERGIHIGTERIPYMNITSFSIKDETPPRLVLLTRGLMGTVSLPLGGADYRAIRTELKNRNIDEDDDLDSAAEKLARAIGI